MSEAAVRVLADDARLAEGESVRFELVLDGISREAFALRWRGEIVAYVNACRHQSLPLDRGGRFLDPAQGEIVCVHHGARYRPGTGECAGGPCAGGRLTALGLERRGTEVWCTGRARPG